MTDERAIEILDPEHREHYESIEPVEEACRIGMNAIKRVKELEAENAELRARLNKAVELPCIEPMTTWDWDANTGCGKAHFGKFWKVLYRDNDGEFIAYMGATKEEATAMLAELKGEKK